MKKYYYSIGEVSNLLDLKDYILRYWEKEFPQLNPKKKFGRNRKYTPEDIELLRRIKYMLYTQRFTIDGVRKKLKEMCKNKQQIKLDFPLDKKKIKTNILEQLQEIKKLLQQ